MIHWIAALRLKALPLALGAILLGSMLQEYAFDLNIFLWVSGTAILLQVEFVIPLIIPWNGLVNPILGSICKHITLPSLEQTYCTSCLWQIR
jgi:uncharacterized membrane protein